MGSDLKNLSAIKAFFKDFVEVVVCFHFAFFWVPHAIAGEYPLLKMGFCIGVYSETKKGILRDMRPEMLRTEQTKQIINLIDNEIAMLRDALMVAQNDKAVDSLKLFGAEFSGREQHKRYLTDAQKMCKIDSNVFSEEAQDNYTACADALHPDVGECRKILDRKWRALVRHQP
jgi:hypothetical protein